MDDLISRQSAIDALHGYFDGMLETDTWSPCDVYGLIEILPSVDAVEVVRCKDCKHRPTGESRDDLEFPDDKCPCKCEDYWYSWKPSDNWFCGNGERKDSNYRGERKYGRFNQQTGGD